MNAQSRKQWTHKTAPSLKNLEKKDVLRWTCAEKTLHRRFKKNSSFKCFIIMIFMFVIQCDSMWILDQFYACGSTLFFCIENGNEAKIYWFFGNIKVFVLCFDKFFFIQKNLNACIRLMEWLKNCKLLELVKNQNEMKENKLILLNMKSLDLFSTSYDRKERPQFNFALIHRQTLSNFLCNLIID